MCGSLPHLLIALESFTQMLLEDEILTALYPKGAPARFHSYKLKDSPKSVSRFRFQVVSTQKCILLIEELLRLSILSAPPAPIALPFSETCTAQWGK